MHEVGGNVKRREDCTVLLVQMLPGHQEDHYYSGLWQMYEAEVHCIPLDCTRVFKMDISIF